jgi:hypothetical protein
MKKKQKYTYKNKELNENLGLWVHPLRVFLSEIGTFFPPPHALIDSSLIISHLRLIQNSNEALR